MGKDVFSKKDLRHLYALVYKKEAPFTATNEWLCTKIKRFIANDEFVIKEYNKNYAGLSL